MYLVLMVNHEWATHAERFFYFGEKPRHITFGEFDIEPFSADEIDDFAIYINLFDAKNPQNQQNLCPNFLLTADNSLQDIDDLLTYHRDNLLNVYFYVADFKDGRVFSLIKHLRAKDYQNDVIVVGDFGLDQATYFYKSGATGFVVSHERLPILLHTLQDLQSAHHGQSVNGLPMFR